MTILDFPGCRVAVLQTLTGTPQQRLHAQQAVLRALALDNSVIAHKTSGAPFIEGLPDVYISISHSRHHYALAVANRPVGIDVEDNRTHLPRLIARVANPADNPALSPLELWTAKEALFKAQNHLPEAPVVLSQIPVPTPGFILHHHLLTTETLLTVALSEL